ncbi:MAG TPA: hypothetical protein VGE23_01715 [Candidatus Paceibacterota bacterium]
MHTKTIAEFHYGARPVLSLEECRTAPPIDTHHQNFAEPHRYRYEPEKERRPDHTERPQRRW